MRSFDVDLTRVRASVVQHQTSDNQHVRRHVTVLTTLNVVLLIAVDDLINNVINLYTVVTRQHSLGVLVNPLNLSTETQTVYTS